MHSLHFHNLAHWFFQFESYGPAILVTIGAALADGLWYRRSLFAV